jgi:hypothetical protein
LNHNFVIARDETRNSRGRYGDAIFLGLNFLRHTDDHVKRLRDGERKGKREE